MIILSDSDEIPDLSKIHKINKNKKFIAFSQTMFMYKLNLQNIEESGWIGSRISKKKDISTMQNLRDLKFKNYPFWRIDKDIGCHQWWVALFLFADTNQIFRKNQIFSHGEFNR